MHRIDASILWVMEPKNFHASALEFTEAVYPLILILITYIGIKLQSMFFFCCFHVFVSVPLRGLPQWWLTSNEGLGKARTYLHQVPQD